MYYDARFIWSSNDRTSSNVFEMLEEFLEVFACAQPGACLRRFTKTGRQREDIRYTELTGNSSDQVRRLRTIRCIKKPLLCMAKISFSLYRRDGHFGNCWYVHDDGIWRELVVCCSYEIQCRVLEMWMEARGRWYKCSIIRPYLVRVD